MKTHRKLMLCLAVLSLAAFSSARAETDTAAAPVVTAPEHPKKHTSQLDGLAAKLQLNDDQKEKVSVILKDEKAAQKVLKKDTSVPEEVKKARQREIADQHNSQIRELLTSDQQTTFDQMNAKAAISKRL